MVTGVQTCALPISARAVCVRRGVWCGCTGWAVGPGRVGWAVRPVRTARAVWPVRMGCAVWAVRAVRMGWPVCLLWVGECLIGDRYGVCPRVGGGYGWGGLTGWLIGLPVGRGRDLVIVRGFTVVGMAREGGRGCGNRLTFQDLGPR